MIILDIRRWTVAHLVGASASYWLGLAAATLTPFARAVISVAGLGGERGAASASLGDAGATLTVLKDGATIYAATAPVLDVALWLAVPPLALWMLWLAFRPSHDSASAMHASPPAGALPDPAQGVFTERAAGMRSPLPAERHQQRS